MAAPSTFTASDIAPSQTIYINNLTEKIKAGQLRKSLYTVFGQFGRILQIKVSHALKLRGQAWVVFEDVTAATNALRQMQGFTIYGKIMRIQFAKDKSDLVARAEGTYVPKEKRKREGGVESAAKRPASGPVVMVPALPPKVVATPPNHVLFVENLPKDVTIDIIKPLFGQYPGLDDVRLVSAKRVAFVYYGDEAQSTVAMQGLNGFQMGSSDRISVTYAKK